MLPTNGNGNKTRAIGATGAPDADAGNGPPPERGRGWRRGRRAMPRHRVLTLQEVATIYFEDCRVQSAQASARR